MTVSERDKTEFRYIERGLQPFGYSPLLRLDVIGANLYLLCNVSLCFSLRLNRYDTAVAVTSLEGYNTVRQCVERVVASHTDIFARIVNRTTLADDDITGNTRLPAPNFNT